MSWGELCTDFCRKHFRILFPQVLQPNPRSILTHELKIHYSIKPTIQDWLLKNYYTNLMSMMIAKMYLDVNTDKYRVGSVAIAT